MSEILGKLFGRKSAKFEKEGSSTAKPIEDNSKSKFIPQFLEKSDPNLTEEVFQNCKTSFIVTDSDGAECAKIVVSADFPLDEENINRIFANVANGRELFNGLDLDDFRDPDGEYRDKKSIISSIKDNTPSANFALFANDSELSNNPNVAEKPVAEKLEKENTKYDDKNSEEERDKKSSEKREDKKNDKEILVEKDSKVSFVSSEELDRENEKDNTKKDSPERDRVRDRDKNLKRGTLEQLSTIKHSNKEGVDEEIKDTSLKATIRFGTSVGNAVEDALRDFMDLSEEEKLNIESPANKAKVQEIRNDVVNIDTKVDMKDYNVEYQNKDKPALLDILQNQGLMKKYEEAEKLMPQEMKQSLGTTDKTYPPGGNTSISKDPKAKISSSRST